MKIKNNNHFEIGLKRQAGAALLISMVVLASVAAFYLMGQFGSKPQKYERQENRIASLAAAKKALIAYAVNYVDTDATHEGRLGFLPCPDVDENGLHPDEGQQDVGCGLQNESAIGRFPYRALDTAVLKDDSNECLWYAVSGYYKNAPETEMLNEDTNGMFEVYDAAGNKIYGANPQDRIVAIVFAPRRLVNNQNRAGVVANTEQCGGNYTVTEYLDNSAVLNDSGAAISNNDLGAADAVDDYVRAGTETDTLNTPFNDQIIVITRDEIWDAVKRRKNYLPLLETLTQNITQCLVDYGSLGAARNLPWPANTDLDGNDYREDSSYVDVAAPASLLGRLPDSVVNSEAALAAGTFPPGPPAGIPPGPPPGGPPGGGGPGGSTACENSCQTTYDNAVADAVADRDEEIAEARGEDYDECLALGTPRPDCNAERRAAIAEARAEYDVEVSEAQIDYAQCVQACGAGGGGVCGDCQALYDALVAEAVADRDEEIAEARGSDYQECLNDGNSRSVCNQERRDDIADANADYNQDLVDAQAELNQCQADTSSCSGGGSGEKGINEILTGCLASADFTLWQHWKDHFYYAVSGDYAPDSTVTNCNANCVSVNGTNQAGIVFFAGERQLGLSRNDPVAGDVDTKAQIENYLEGNNSANYLDANGNGQYTPAGGNDYLYCISDSDPLVAGACP